ncbi:hypothetical protein BV898_09304 [Hypsibius exemplaris]|uniref:Uncharacterized protein n=1 Tax=Hypsibius exemplaris TaxID=2072580 RepID=A0A1W0WN48_HYPEX|nr:hypothetical protein BV898_09304 [Hypsibius exemplaris]
MSLNLVILLGVVLAVSWSGGARKQHRRLSAPKRRRTARKHHKPCHKRECDAGRLCCPTALGRYICKKPVPVYGHGD